MLRHIPKEPKMRASTMLEAQARAVYKELCADYRNEKLAGVKMNEKDMAVLHDVRDRTGAIWYMRDQEQDVQQRARDAYIKTYRPVLSLSDDPIKATWDYFVEQGYTHHIPTWLD